MFDLVPKTKSAERLREVLRSSCTCSFEVRYAAVGENGVACQQLCSLLSTFSPDASFLFTQPEGSGRSGEIFREFHRGPKSSPVIAVVDSTNPQHVAEALTNGASDFLVEPFRDLEVLPRLRRLLEQRREGSGSFAGVKDQAGLQQLVGDSPAWLRELDKAPRFAASDATVLITGETGTGKELYARAVHRLSRRSTQAFVPLNCGAVPVELVENELFGHEAGAYTSARTSASGLIEHAHGGTLFLDEVDALPMAAQVKLLRFIQDREYRALGSSKICKADVRIVAATNAVLEEAVRGGRFRQDLFYRINVLRVVLPPLRDRDGDIVALAQYFLERYARQSAKPLAGFTTGALQRLVFYDWPGNVRELENVIERAVILAESTHIQSGDIHLPMRDDVREDISFQTLKAKAVADFERKYLSELLHAHGGNISKAAQTAGKHRRAFWELLRKHRIGRQNDGSIRASER